MWFVCGMSAALVGGTVMAQTGTGTGSRMGSTTGMGTQGTKLVELPSDEKGILERLHHSNQNEIQLAQLVKEKGTNPQLKDFAQMLITDHTQADQKLMTYAKTKKLSLGEPKPMNDMERKMMSASKANMEVFKTLKGPMFDQVVTAHLVSSHDKTLDKLVTITHSNQSQELTSMATELIPKISQHRDEAYRILSAVKLPVGGVGGAGQSGDLGHDTMPSSPGQEPARPMQRQ
jgi:putative membrane protein